MGPAPIAVLAFLTLAACADARGRPGRARSAPVKSLAFSVLPETFSTDRPHWVRVVREVATPEDARILEMAEALPPGRPDPRSCGHFMPPSEEAQVARTFWCDGFDGVRIAHSVTGEAALYYLELSRALASGRVDGVMPMMSTWFTYEARVEPSAPVVDGGGVRHDDVRQVTLTLSWSDTCGDLCGLSFFKSRTVVLDAHGCVFFVGGDGPPEFTVS